MKSNSKSSVLPAEKSNNLQNSPKSQTNSSGKDKSKPDKESRSRERRNSTNDKCPKSRSDKNSGKAKYSKTNSKNKTKSADQSKEKDNSNSPKEERSAKKNEKRNRKTNSKRLPEEELPVRWDSKPCDKYASKNPRNIISKNDGNSRKQRKLKMDSNGTSSAKAPLTKRESKSTSRQHHKAISRGNSHVKNNDNKEEITVNGESKSRRSSASKLVQKTRNAESGNSPSKDRVSKVSGRSKQQKRNESGRGRRCETPKPCKGRRLNSKLDNSRRLSRRRKVRSPVMTWCAGTTRRREVSRELCNCSGVRVKWVGSKACGCRCAPAAAARRRASRASRASRGARATPTSAVRKTPRKSSKYNSNSGEIKESAARKSKENSIANDKDNKDASRAISK